MQISTNESINNKDANYITGKLHINFNDSDIIIHCTDNPGRITFLRTSVLQVQKGKPNVDFSSCFIQCINDLIHICHEKHISSLYVKVVNRRSDGLQLLNVAMQRVVEGNIHVFPATSLSSQPSSKTRRPLYDTHRRRYHKDSYSQAVQREVQSWRSSMN